MTDLRDSEYYPELETAWKAARRAGEVMDRYRRKGAEISGRKDGLNDIVTQADLKSQETIVDEISEEFPEDDFKGEEKDLTPLENSNRVWVIDPIDGTTNYFSGWTYFCTAIALRVDGEYKVGVIHSPSTGLDKTWVAVKNHGSYKVEGGLDDLKRLQVSDRKTIESGFFSCFQSPDNDERRKIEQELIERLISKDMNYRECGSGATLLPEMAEGGIDARFDFVNEWDYAASSLVLEEAGGKFEKIGTRFGKDTVVSTNGKLHSKFKKEVKEVLSNF